MSEVKDNNEINYPLTDAEKDDDLTEEEISEKEIQYQRDLKRFIIPQLRRATYRWAPRNQALVLARVGPNQYKCAMCGGIFKKDEIAIDHIEPVVSLQEGWVNWHLYVTRMFPPVEGFQILCNEDHDSKTLQEDAVRAIFNAKRKAVKKAAKELEKQQKKEEKERLKAEKKAAKGK